MIVMSRDSLLKEKSFAFALRITRLFQYLRSKHKDYELSKQILRCGTSVGALIREAEYAQSRKDFLNKLTVSAKEMNETIYWLELFLRSGDISTGMYDSIMQDAEPILKMLIASIKTTKSRL
jgi:four helix bundle protein